MLERANELKKYDINTPFLQEILWFHRIEDDQDKELLTLEFLNVCAGHFAEGKLFDTSLTNVKYRKDIYVRNILYNFPELESIVKSANNDNVKWEQIETILQKNLDQSYNYKYLKNRFESVDIFYTSIILLRKASLGLETSRRWTSKFLFPFSFETLFIDIDNRKKSFSMDRRFFSRGGEVLYMMVSRAKNADLLKPLILDVFEKSPQNKRWNDLLDTLRPDKNSEKIDAKLGFLGTKSHQVFDQLVDDLIALLRTNIPHNDFFNHFAAISSFYMVHFILTIAIQNSKKSLLRNQEEKIVYPIEILAPRGDNVRRSSRAIYKVNEDLPLEALFEVFKNYMETLKDIQDKDLLREKLFTEINYKDENDILDIEKLKDDVWNKIEAKAKRDLRQMHRILLRDIGLASSKKTNSYRYLASDNWLKTLVLINIEIRMPFDNFIDLLYEKYGFIISNKHSQYLIQPYSENEFKKNKDRLFQRLKALGLLESKSDGYAYVINTHGRK